MATYRYEITLRIEKNSIDTFLAWSIAMACHAQHVAAWDAVRLAALYVPLCFGIKSLVGKLL